MKLSVLALDYDGTFTRDDYPNASVLAAVADARPNQLSDVVVCVNNLSRFPQPVELDLSRFIGWTPVELTGRVQFPPIGELPYLLTLPGHGFYWFQLAPPEDRM